MESSKIRARELRKNLKSRLYPFLIERGFTRLKHSSTFSGFARVQGDDVHLVEFQWDKYHRPKFVVNIGRIELLLNNDVQGFENRMGEWQPLAELGSGSPRQLVRIHDGKRFEKWFKYGFLRSIFARDGGIKTIMRCQKLLDASLGWFEADENSKRVLRRMNPWLDDS